MCLHTGNEINISEYTNISSNVHMTKITTETLHNNAL